jgi:hypothetical protein
LSLDYFKYRNFLKDIKALPVHDHDRLLQCEYDCNLIVLALISLCRLTPRGNLYGQNGETVKQQVFRENIYASAALSETDFLIVGDYGEIFRSSAERKNVMDDKDNLSGKEVFGYLGGRGR